MPTIDYSNKLIQSLGGWLCALVDVCRCSLAHEGLECVSNRGVEIDALSRQSSTPISCINA